MKILKTRIGSLLYRIGIVAIFFLLIQVPPMAILIANRHPGNQFLAVILSLLFVMIFLFIIITARRVYHRYNQMPASGLVDLRLVVAGYLVIMVGMIFFGWLNQAVFHQGETANNEIIRRMLNHNLIITVVFVISSFTLTPIAEELIFRGILTNLFFRRDSFWPKIFLSGLVFSAAHSSTTIASFLLYCFMGMVLAYVYRRSDNLKNSMLLHALNNLIAIIPMLLSIS